MSNETLFYICGIGLAVSAVLFSFVGLKVKNFPGQSLPAGRALVRVLVGGATTFAVLHAQGRGKGEGGGERGGRQGNRRTRASDAPSRPPAKEEAAKKPKAAGEAEASTEGPGRDPAAGQPTPTDLAFDTTKLSSKPGKVTIDFENPSALEHNVAIEAERRNLAESETLAEGKTSVTAELAPGTYTFLCTVPDTRSRHGRHA